MFLSQSIESLKKVEKDSGPKKVQYEGLSGYSGLYLKNTLANWSMTVQAILILLSQ